MLVMGGYLSADNHGKTSACTKFTPLGQEVPCFGTEYHDIKMLSNYKNNDNYNLVCVLLMIENHVFFVQVTE